VSIIHPVNGQVKPHSPAKYPHLFAAQSGLANLCCRIVQPPPKARYTQPTYEGGTNSVTVTCNRGGRALATRVQRFADYRLGMDSVVYRGVTNSPLNDFY
jgi:hypothetical protein